MPALTAPALFRRVAVALAATLVAGASLGEETTITRAIQAASLHEGPLDMVAYYMTTPDGALEVTATFAPREAPGPAETPMRVVMALGEGDDVTFAMPGYPEALYRFSRAGDAVTVSVRAVPPAGL